MQRLEAVALLAQMDIVVRSPRLMARYRLRLSFMVAPFLGRNETCLNDNLSPNHSTTSNIFSVRWWWQVIPIFFTVKWEVFPCVHWQMAFIVPIGLETGWKRHRNPCRIIVD